MKNWEEKIKVRMRNTCGVSWTVCFRSWSQTDLFALRKRSFAWVRRNRVQVLMAQPSHLFPIESSAMCLFLNYKDSFYVILFISFGESYSLKPLIEMKKMCILFAL